MNTAEAIARAFESEAVAGNDLNSANVVDVLAHLAQATACVARSITPPDAIGNEDACGGHVESLTEAVMGMTGGLARIADSISELADAVRSLDLDHTT